jgi:hypothetical protein
MKSNQKISAFLRLKQRQLAEPWALLLSGSCNVFIYLPNMNRLTYK